MSSCFTLQSRLLPGTTLLPHCPPFRYDSILNWHVLTVFMRSQSLQENIFAAIEQKACKSNAPLTLGAPVGAGSCSRFCSYQHRLLGAARGSSSQRCGRWHAHSDAQSTAAKCQVGAQRWAPQAQVPARWQEAGKRWGQGQRAHPTALRAGTAPPEPSATKTGAASARRAAR